MTLLDRYISKQFLFILFFALIAFTTVFIIVDLIENLDDLISQQVPLGVAIELYLYSLPFMVILILPVAMLLASLFSVGNMSRHNEIVAMKSAGISLYRILLPLFVIGFLMSLVALAFGEYVVPPASERYAYLNDQYLEKHREAWRKRIDQPFVRDQQNRLVSMRYFNTARNIGYFVSIRKFKDQTLLFRIDSRKITWQDSTWVLDRGYIRNFDDGHETATAFTNYKLDDTNLVPEDFARFLKEPEQMSYKELSLFIKEVERNGSKPDRWLVDLYLKIAIPFANLIIVLFGAPLSSPKRRGSTATGFGISLAICFIYFGIVKTAQAMGQAGTLDPLFAAWIANIIFAIAGVIVLVKATRT